MKVGVTREEQKVYVFEDFRLDAGKRLLFDSKDEILPLMPKAFDILLYLVSNGGRVIEKDELMSAVWPDTVVEENNLTQNISAIRRALGEKHRENRFIATVPGRGYKFVADVLATDGRLAAVESSVGAITANGENPEMAVHLNEPSVNKNENRIGGRFWVGLFGVVTLLGLATTGFLFWDGRPQAPAGEVDSIAVLPFKPISADKRDESLELGMADTLIMKLGGGDRVSVRPLAAVRRFSALEQDAIEAGRALAVDAVLDGSIQISDERVRVSVRLVRVADSRQLWAGQFDENLMSIFAVQDSIAQRVASELNFSLGNHGRKSYTESIEAYQHYMRGNLHARRLVRPEVEKGIAYYELAIAVDPGFALAYVEIANAHRALVLTSDARPSEMMPIAKAAALKAVELDDELAEAWTALAISDFWYDWDWRTAETHHRRALELNAKSAQARFFYAHLLSNTGRHEEAITEIRRARELDPISLLTNAVEGQILFFAGQTEQASLVLKRTIDMDPNFWLAHLFLSRVHLKNGMYDEAIASARRAAELSGGSAEAIATVGFALAGSDRAGEARSVLAELTERSRTRYVPSYALAQIHAALGERETALDLLEKAFADREALMVFLKLEPKWDNLRSEPRFIDLMRRMNFD